MMQQTVPVVEKLFHDGVMVRFLQRCFMDSVFCDLDDFRERVGHDDWQITPFSIVTAMTVPSCTDCNRKGSTFWLLGVGWKQLKIL